MLRTLAVVLILSSSMSAGAVAVPESLPLAEPQHSWVEVSVPNSGALADHVLDLASSANPITDAQSLPAPAVTRRVDLETLDSLPLPLITVLAGRSGLVGTPEKAHPEIPVVGVAETGDPHESTSLVVSQRGHPVVPHLVVAATQRHAAALAASAYAAAIDAPLLLAADPDHAARLIAHNAIGFTPTVITVVGLAAEGRLRDEIERVHGWAIPVNELNAESDLALQGEILDTLWAPLRPRFLTIAVDNDADLAAAANHAARFQAPLFVVPADDPDSLLALDAYNRHSFNGAVVTLSVGPDLRQRIAATIGRPLRLQGPEVVDLRSHRSSLKEPGESGRHVGFGKLEESYPTLQQGEPTMIEGAPACEFQMSGFIGTDQAAEVHIRTLAEDQGTCRRLLVIDVWAEPVSAPTPGLADIENLPMGDITPTSAANRRTWSQSQVDEPLVSACLILGISGCPLDPTSWARLEMDHIANGPCNFWTRQRYWGVPLVVPGLTVWEREVYVGDSGANAGPCIHRWMKLHTRFRNVAFLIDLLGLCPNPHGPNAVAHHWPTYHEVFRSGASYHSHNTTVGGRCSGWLEPRFYIGQHAI